MELLVHLLAVVIVLGLLYGLVTLLPLPAQFKNIANVIVIILAIFWLLSVVGIMPVQFHYR